MILLRLVQDLPCGQEVKLTGFSSYQACVLPQCGQDTLVETGAMKKHPHPQG